MTKQRRRSGKGIGLQSRRDWLSEVDAYLVSDDIEANAHEQKFGVLKELHMEEDVPVREALLSMIADERYVQLWPVLAEILGEPRLAQGLQAVSKPQ